MYKPGESLVLRTLGLLFTGLLASQPAIAHHPVGGTVPVTLWQGLLSGFGHPVIELDHFAFLVGAAVVAAMGNASHWKAIRWLAGYAVAGAVGTALQVFGVNVPWAGAAVVASLAGIALCLFMQSAPKCSVIALMVGAAGLAHGYAYGEAVIGAEATPLVAYLAGLALVQMALLVLVFKTVRALLLIAPLRWQGVFRALGVLVAFVSVWSGAGLLP